MVLPLVPLHGPECQQTHPVSQLSQTAESCDSNMRLVDSTFRPRSEELNPSQSWKGLSQSPSVVQVYRQKPLEHCAYLMAEVPILA